MTAPSVIATALTKSTLAARPMTAERGRQIGPRKRQHDARDDPGAHGVRTVLSMSRTPPKWAAIATSAGAPPIVRTGDSVAASTTST